MAAGLMNFILNLTLTWYYFKNLLLSRDINSHRLLPDVNKPFRLPFATAILNVWQYGGHER
jgi:hypothetical protein